MELDLEHTIFGSYVWKEAFSEGFTSGYQQSWQEGFALGRRKVLEESQLRMAQDLLKRDKLTLEQIREVTELPLEKLEEIQKQL